MLNFCFLKIKKNEINKNKKNKINSNPYIGNFRIELFETMDRDTNGRFKKKNQGNFIEENDDGRYELKFPIPNLMTVFCWFLFAVVTIPWFIILLNSDILTKGGYYIKNALGMPGKPIIMDNMPTGNGYGAVASKQNKIKKPSSFPDKVIQDNIHDDVPVVNINSIDDDI